MNRIPKLTLIYPLSSSTRELHEAKAASVKEKVFHTGISQIGRSFIHKYVKKYSFAIASSQVLAYRFIIQHRNYYVNTTKLGNFICIDVWFGGILCNQMAVNKLQ